MRQSDALLRRFEEVVAPVIDRCTNLTFVRGEGVHLYDADGRKYLDFAPGIATTVAGHCHPRVVEAVTEQSRTFMHAAAHIGVMEPYVRLLEKLRSLAPGALRFGKGMLINSGAEAVEPAVEMARSR